MFDKNLISATKKLLTLARKSKVKIVTAESCTGGLLSALITSIPGSSEIFDRGFIVYSNESKTEILGVKKSTLKKYGAVSSGAAKELALGAIKNSNAQISIAITGIAGPKNDGKPIGLVHIASYNKLNKKLINNELQLFGNRDEIRISSVKEAIRILIKQIPVC
jgi:PncC family amidohydrolase